MTQLDPGGAACPECKHPIFWFQAAYVATMQRSSNDRLLPDKTYLNWLLTPIQKRHKKFEKRVIENFYRITGCHRPGVSMETWRAGRLVRAKCNEEKAGRMPADEFQIYQMLNKKAIA